MKLCFQTKRDLEDFWEYWQALYDYMMEQCEKTEEQEEQYKRGVYVLPDRNVAIISAFAVSTFKEAVPINKLHELSCCYTEKTCELKDEIKKLKGRIKKLKSAGKEEKA